MNSIHLSKSESDLYIRNLENQRLNNHLNLWLFVVNSQWLFGVLKTDIQASSYAKDKKYKITGVLSSEKEESFNPEPPFKIRNFAKEFFQRPTKTNFKAKYTKTHTHYTCTPYTHKPLHTHTL